MLSKIQGCLMGVMIGDAMGMPVEMMTPDAILAATDGKGITTFIDSIQRKIKDTIELPAGSTTDDWQLTKVVAESLIRCGGFDMLDMAMGHIRALEESTTGWGTTTRVGLEQMRDYFRSFGREGRHPLAVPEATVNAQGVRRGCGNGIAMKVAPIALAHVVRKTRIDKQYPTLMGGELKDSVLSHILTMGQMTHPDARASIAAFAVARIIVQNVSSAYKDNSVTVDSLINSCRFYENYTRILDPDTFTGRLEKLQDPELLYGPIEKLREEVGTGCLAMESVCFAIAVFFRNRNDFESGILEAVNSGGDADSTASIAGALIGSVVGLEGIPAHWQNFSPNFQEALSIGSELFEAFAE